MMTVMMMENEEEETYFERGTMGCEISGMRGKIQEREVMPRL